MSEDEKETDGWDSEQSPKEKPKIEEKPQVPTKQDQPSSTLEKEEGKKKEPKEKEKTEIKEKVKPKASALEPSSPFAGVDKPTKLPLILYLISLGFLAIMAIILGLNSGSTDGSLSSDIVTWATSAGLISLFTTWTALIGGLLAPIAIILIGLVFVILHNQKVTKYGGVIVLTAILGLGVNRLLMGIFARALPSSHAAVTAWFTMGTFNDAWMNGSFTSFEMTLAGVLFALPYCFNMKKVIWLKIVTAILALFYVVFMGLALVALKMNWLSDVIFAGVLQFWFAAISAKSVLDYAEVDFLLKQAKEFLTVENVDAKKKAEKGKPVEFQPKIDNALEIIEKSLGKMPQDKNEVQENIKELSSIIENVKSQPKVSKRYNIVDSSIKDLFQILEDNKAFAKSLLVQAKELYNQSVEAAKIEPGDFTDVIKKDKVWIDYTQQFSDGLDKVSLNEGPEFDQFMKENFLYII
jgi:membrane-associated phospholipid phosphatase